MYRAKSWTFEKPVYNDKWDVETTFKQVGDVVEVWKYNFGGNTDEWRKKDTSGAFISERISVEEAARRVVEIEASIAKSEEVRKEILSKKEDFQEYISSLPISIAGLNRVGNTLEDSYGNCLISIPNKAVGWSVDALESYISECLSEWEE